MALVTIVIGLVQAYTDMGISGAIVQRQNATSEQLSSLFWLNVLVGLCFFGLLFLGAPIIARLYGEPRLAGLITCAALALLVAPMGQQFRMLLQKWLRFDTLAATDVISSAAGVAVAVILALHDQGVYSLVWGQMTTTTASTLILLKIGTRNWRPQFRLRHEDISGYLRFGAY